MKAETRRMRVLDRIASEVVAVEEPLEIRVEGQPTAITMRTPGHDKELVVGFLATEGVIDDYYDVRAIAEVGPNVMNVRLHDAAAPKARSADRAFFASSSCGVCGKASIDRLVSGGSVTPWTPDPVTLLRLMVAFEAAQDGTRTTGCMHAAALFEAGGDVRFLREDVGRHNAADKTLGAWLIADQPGNDWGLVTTSRAGFEIVQKAVTLGLGCVCTVGAPTSLAIDTALATGLVLIGWLRPGKHKRYA